jgi:hypothetical protein
MPSTPSAYPQVIWRHFASLNSNFPQLTAIFGLGSIPGSSTTKVLVRTTNPGQLSFASRVGGGQGLPAALVGSEELFRLHDRTARSFVQGCVVA